jgi:hypothetical protein
MYNVVVYVTRVCTSMYIATTLQAENASFEAYHNEISLLKRI